MVAMVFIRNVILVPNGEIIQIVAAAQNVTIVMDGGVLIVKATMSIIKEPVITKAVKIMPVIVLLDSKKKKLRNAEKMVMLMNTNAREIGARKNI